LTGKNGALDIHERSGCHVSNVARALEFTKSAKDPRSHADVQLISHRKQVLQNRQAFVSIVETMKFASIQNIALRGHRDVVVSSLTDATPQTTMETSECFYVFESTVVTLLCRSIFTCISFAETCHICNVVLGAAIVPEIHQCPTLASVRNFRRTSEG